jgi:uncharacterized protein
VDQRLSLVTLGVTDLARAARFYEDGLGWKRKGETEGVVFFQLPGSILALWPRESLAEDAGISAAGSGFSGIALAFNARSPAEVDAVLAEATAAGAKLLKPGTETFWGGYSGYFADLDGHVWEVAHNPGWTLDEAGRVTIP